MGDMAVLISVLVLCLVMTSAFTMIVLQFSQASEILGLEISSQLSHHSIFDVVLEAQNPGSGGGGGGTI